MKRLSRDGWVTPIPQPKDRPYLYMPNPTLIHPNSTRINHFLALVDFYIFIGQPDIYQVEPDLKHSYSPDVYTILDNEHIIIEMQLSNKSNKVMQEKVNGFVDSYVRGKHAAKRMWIVSDKKYNVKVPSGYIVEHIPLNKIKEKGVD